MNRKRYDPEPTSAPGDFYVINHECISCGVPHAVAPELVGWVAPDERHCFWKKQPETAYELQHAFAIFDGQEAGCHRYAGIDPAIQERIGLGNCDNPLPAVDLWVGRARPFSKAFWKKIGRR